MSRPRAARPTTDTQVRHTAAIAIERELVDDAVGRSVRPIREPQIVATYDYVDPDLQTVAFQAVETDLGGYFLRHADSEGGWKHGIGNAGRVLFNAAAVIEAVALGRDVFLVENERTATKLIEQGLTATCCAIGMSSWQESYGEMLTGGQVIIVPDGDTLARNGAVKIAALLVGRKCKAKVVCVPGLDEDPPESALAEWFGQTDAAQRLRSLAESAPFFRTTRLLSDVEIEALPTPAELIEGFLYQATLGQVYGKPGDGKSFLAVHLSFCLATGEPFFGRQIKQRGRTVYITAEGGPGMGARVRAWKTHHLRVGELGVHFLPEPAQFFEPNGDIAALLADIAKLPEPPVLIVVDTQSRCTLGAAENDSRDMGIVVERAHQLRTQTGAMVLFVHHPTKDGLTSRGSGAVAGALDTMIGVSRTDDGTMVLKCEKQKDAAPFDDINAALLPLPSGSCVLVTAKSGALSAGNELTKKQLKALQILHDTADSDGLATGAWEESCELASRTFYSARKVLVTRELVTRLEGKGHPRYRVSEAGEALLTADCQSTANNANGSGGALLPASPIPLGRGSTAARDTGAVA